MTIHTKMQMYYLFESGAFGNKTRSWLNVDDYLESDFRGKVALRYVERPGGPCIYNLERSEVPLQVKLWQSQGYRKELIQVSEMLDERRIRLAGEIMESENYLDLHYYNVPGYHMRDGLKRFGSHAQGLAALGLIHRHMDPASTDNLRRLFADFPGHVVEFTVCQGPVGDLRHNTVFWEVRLY